MAAQSSPSDQAALSTCRYRSSLLGLTGRYLILTNPIAQVLIVYCQLVISCKTQQGPF